MDKIIAPRGTHDVLPDEAPRWRLIEDAMRETADIFGYGEIRTPIFESTALFRRGVGDTTDIVQKEMYTFLHAGKESLTLRPEGTSPVMRSFIENGMASLPTPLKLYYIINCFRAETPQKGRYRQFTQFGVEGVGVAGALMDAEVIAIAQFLFDKLGLRGIELEINSVGCPECRPKYFNTLKEWLSGKREELCEDCRDRFDRNPMRVLDCKKENCRRLTEGAPKITECLCGDCSDHFASLQKNLDALGIDYKVNPRIVRGLDYYTKTAFEFLAPAFGEGWAVCAGGRYDGLVESLGGPPTPGVGFGMGFDRVYLMMEEASLFREPDNAADIYFAPLTDEAVYRSLSLTDKMRRAGLRASSDLTGRSLKAQMKYADKIGSKYVAMIGEDEMKAEEATIRDMTSKVQTRVSFNDIENWLMERVK